MSNDVFNGAGGTPDNAARYSLIPPVALAFIACSMLVLHDAAFVKHGFPQLFRLAIGLPLIIGGLGMAAWHARLFRRLGVNINTFRTPGKFVTEGLFRRSRNPMYLGMLLSLIGLACLLGSLPPFAGPVFFFLLAQFCYIPFEERAMTEKFGARYARYRRDVQRWL